MTQADQNPIRCGSDLVDIRIR